MINDVFEYYRRTDPLVAKCLDEGIGAELTIVALCQRHQELMQQLVMLKSIAPMKVRVGENQFAIWHCPDELIPETKLKT